MGRNLDPKCKQCRRLGEKLFLKGERCNTQKCAMVKRNFAPGLHGQSVARGRKRVSDYGLQLAEKQKVKKYYQLMEKQFLLTFKKSGKRSGDHGINFLSMLETRLDNVLLRLTWASSHTQARQIVNHGHITVNGRKVDIPSYQVKPGSIIKIKKSSLNSKFFRDLKDRMKKSELPSWLHYDSEDMSAKVLHEPQGNDLPQNFKVHMIIEYYSK